MICTMCCFQVINNACATQAIISVLLNVGHSDIELGTVLTEFKEFAGQFDPAVSIYHWVLIRSYCDLLMH